MAGKATARRRSLYVLGLASPTHPLSDDSFGAWTETYQWENIYDYDFLYAGPLFIHLFSHAWIDFAGIRDRVHARKEQRLFREQPARRIVQREYAWRNPHGFIGLRQGLLGHHGE